MRKVQKQGESAMDSKADDFRNHVLFYLFFYWALETGLSYFGASGKA